MSGKSRNEGVRTIAQFRDRAIPLGKTPQTPGAHATEKKDEAIQTLADFTDPAPPAPRLQNDPGTPNPSPPGEGGPTTP